MLYKSEIIECKFYKKIYKIFDKKYYVIYKGFFIVKKRKMNTISFIIIVLVTLIGCSKIHKGGDSEKRTTSPPQGKLPTTEALGEKPSTPAPTSDAKAFYKDKIELDLKALQLNQDLQALNKALKHTVQSTEDMNVEPLLKSQAHKLYEENIMEAVKNKLKAKYNRGELAFLEDKSLTTPSSSATGGGAGGDGGDADADADTGDDEKPYSFQSPKGEFLDKVQGLYHKLYEANPYHPQGMKARVCGLSMLKVADKEYKKSKVKAQIALIMAEHIISIVSGSVIPSDFKKSGVETSAIYELCTGTTLLTGQEIKNTAVLMSVTLSYFVHQGLILSESDYKALWDSINAT